LILRLLRSVVIGGLGLGACANYVLAQTQIRYLSGTGKDDAVLWDFFCTSGRKSGNWTRIPVPSCWEQQDFGGYNYGRNRISDTNPRANEQGKYRLRFKVPPSWKGKIVRLVFDGSMTDTEVWVNGQPAGPVHQGSFYRFKYDITPLLKFGDSNLLEVTVSKVSANESVNRAENSGVDYWVFGGIFRPVYLEALPQRFIDWTAIDARADGSFSVDLYMDGPAVAANKVTAQILDESGAPIGQPFSGNLFPAQKALRLETKIATPKLWTAETPNLYSVRLTLSENAKPLHTITERFGFRTFEVRAGDGLYLNGQRIILKGANRHSFWPETGRTLSRQVSYDDVQLIKELNMNAVRMSHYPPDAHFLEACDEVGLYVLDELGGWQRSYDTPTGRRLISEMVPRDVNHPSILLWDNGNEGGWNRENDDEFAKWDPQKRVVLHPWELFGGVNTDHYEKFDSHMKLSAGRDIYMPTEFLHGLYDGGAGAGLWDYWELIRKSKVGGGGFIWALVDECIARTDQDGRLDCAGNQAPDGIVGPHREHEGSFNTVREIWSPVQVVGPQRLPDDFRGVFQIENRYDFTNLGECSFAWQLARFPAAGQNRSGHMVISSGVTKGPNIPPHGAGELQLQLPASRLKSDVFYLTARDPQGHELWTWSWGFARPSDVGRIEAKKAFADVQTPRAEGGRLLVEARSFELRFDSKTGFLVEVGRRGKTIPFGNGPRFVAFRRNDRKYAEIAGPGELRYFRLSKEGREVIVDASYNGPLSKVRWRILDDDVRLDYEYSFEGTVDMIGVQFDFPEKQIKGIRWLGRGPYRVWQNRMQGTRLDVWENVYNDTTPGESWVYPEFKGYFRDWRWASFITRAGNITISTAADDSFLGIYKPKDGKDGLLDLPEIGIAVLDTIPAMRNKFHTTDEIGPQSKPKQVSGVKRGTIHFRFSD
jgi:hypothetical protein